MGYKATKHRVSNRGIPPDAFLNELVRWGKGAPDEIFAPNSIHDVYTNVFRALGPWDGPRHRRSVMVGGPVTWKSLSPMLDCTF